VSAEISSAGSEVVSNLSGSSPSVDGRSRVLKPLPVVLATRYFRSTSRPCRHARRASGSASPASARPTAGGVGNLPILAFNAPSVFSVDMALSKRFSILKKYNIEFRGEAFNLFNAVYFYMGDMNINSATFGRITGTAIGARVVQLTVRFDF
jgi:hypothetical protein